MKKAIVFGATGTIGLAIVSEFQNQNWSVISVSRSKNISNGAIYANVLDDEMDNLKEFGTFDSVCFAQGANLNDSIFNFDAKKHLELYNTNCLFILKAVDFLLKNDLLATNSSIVVISSIWQNISRKDKMSYIITKSALAGMVRSLAIDLAKYSNGKTCLVNSILPGALESSMTMANLTNEQIAKLQEMTPTKNLATPDDIASAVVFLSGQTAMTGQMIEIDNGFSYAKFL